VKKLVLDIDRLRVDSYETSVEKTNERGTVWGHRETTTSRTWDFTCRGSGCGTPTNAGSCYGNAQIVEQPVDDMTEPQYREAELWGMAPR
jgi:hypothetical protein